MVKVFSKNSNLCDHNSPTSQTDGRTDRQTTCDRNTALCTKVHRAVITANIKNKPLVGLLVDSSQEAKFVCQAQRWNTQFEGRVTMNERMSKICPAKVQILSRSMTIFLITCILVEYTAFEIVHFRFLAHFRPSWVVTWLTLDWVIRQRHTLEYQSSTSI